MDITHLVSKAIDLPSKTGGRHSRQRQENTGHRVQWSSVSLRPLSGDRMPSDRRREFLPENGMSSAAVSMQNRMRSFRPPITVWGFRVQLFTVRTIPASICSKMIINAGIERIVYEEGYADALAPEC